MKTTATFEGSEKDAIVKSGPIRCVDVDASFTHVVTSGEDKQLKVWRLEDLKLLSERCVVCTYTLICDSMEV